MQTVEYAACRDYFTAHYGCAVCLAVCPFSQAGYAKVQAKFSRSQIRHQPAMAMAIKGTTRLASYESRPTPATSPEKANQIGAPRRNPRASSQ